VDRSVASKFYVRDKRFWEAKSKGFELIEQHELRSVQVVEASNPTITRYDHDDVEYDGIDFLPHDY
jgi:hypothetical protein